MKLYYTEIRIEAICKNGSEKYGANALTSISTSPYGKFFEISHYGHTKQAAYDNLMKNLIGDGDLELVELKSSEEVKA